MRYLLDESGRDGAECSKVMSGRRVASVIRSLANASLSMLILHKTRLWEEEKSRVRVIQIDNLRGLLDIRRMDRLIGLWTN